MKRQLIGIILGIITFSLSLSLVYFLSFKSIKRCYPKAADSSKNYELIETKIPKNEIDLKFKGYVLSKKESLVEFTVINNNDQTIKYYSNPISNTEIFPIYEFKINGKEIERWRCGTGLILYPIKSGETNVFKIDLRGVSYDWQKGKSVQIGFSFKKDSEKEFKTIWSENLPITPKIEKELLREKGKL